MGRTVFTQTTEIHFLLGSKYEISIVYIVNFYFFNSLKNVLSRVEDRPLTLSYVLMLMSFSFILKYRHTKEKDNVNLLLNKPRINRI